LLLVASELSGGSGVETALWLVVPLVLCVLILALADRWVLVIRALLKRRREIRKRPGASPLIPLQVSQMCEIAERRAMTCRCGGNPKRVFQGLTLSQHQRRLWLVIEICPRCQLRMQTYFDVTRVRDQVAGLGEAQPLTPVN